MIECAHTGYKRERKNGKFGPLPLSIPFQSQTQQDGVPPFHLTTRAINRITGPAKRPAQMHKEKRALAHSTHIKETQGVPEDLIHFFSNLNLHISAPTFTHMGDYPARPMEGKIPLTHTSPCL